MYMYMCIHTCPILIPFISLQTTSPQRSPKTPTLNTYMSTYSRYDESSDDVILMSHPVQNRGNESICSAKIFNGFFKNPLQVISQPSECFCYVIVLRHTFLEPDTRLRRHAYTSPQAI